MRKKKKLLLLVVLLLAVAAIVQGLVLIRYGFSARGQPSAVETYVARTSRAFKI